MPPPGAPASTRTPPPPAPRCVRPPGFLPPAPQNRWPARAESHDTTHYSVVDSQGNAVAVTTTLNDSFGSRVTAGSLGFLLNDEMDDFAVKLGVPNLYGLIQGPADAIAPGKRPLSAMTPTIVLENGKLRFVLGSPGGARIISTVANIFLSAAEGGLNIQQAVDAPASTTSTCPTSSIWSRAFHPQAIAALRSQGYELDIRTATGPTASASPSILKPASLKADRTIAATSAKLPDIRPYRHSSCVDVVDK